MELAQEYARRGRNGTANKLMKLRYDISQTRRDRDNGDIDGPQKLLDELHSLRSMEADPEMQRRLDDAIREMDFPLGPEPDLPEGTPPAARQLLKNLERIPVARAPKGSHLHGLTTTEDSPVERLAQIFRDIHSSNGDISVGDVERRIERVLGTYHESVDGSYRMQSLWHRLDKDSSLSKELKDWVAQLRKREPLMGNKKLGPNTAPMLSERTDLTPGTPAIKKPKQLTPHEIGKLTDGQVVGAFEANKISRADAAAELRRRALDLDTAAGHLELREHHIGHPEAMEMRRVADQNRIRANDIETGVLLRTGEKTTAQVAAERRALRDANRIKAARIAKAQGSATYARDLEQILEATMHDGNDDRLRTLIRERFDSKAPGQQREEADGWNEVRGAIGEMLPGESREQFQERMRGVLKQHGIELDGHAGDWVDYSPDNHDLLAGDTKAGNAVQTLVPGISYVDEDGSRVQLSKPLVQTKADALAEGLVPEKLSSGKAPRVEHGVLTGTETVMTPVHMALDKDTGPEGIPVRDLELYSGYKISDGRAWRRNGVTYVAEHDPEDKEHAERMMRFMEEHHARVPEEGRQFQRSYEAVLGGNPKDERSKRRLGITDSSLESRASSGNGHTTVWHSRDKDLSTLGATLDHEVGHNVANEVRRRKLGATQTGFTRWHLDAAADGNPVTQGRIFDFRPGESHIAEHIPRAISPTASRKGVRFPDGSTTYGRLSPAEDFADSHALYLMGPIGEGRLTPSGPMEPVYFRDLWPRKAAHLDEVYPEFGARQVQEITARRGGVAPTTAPARRTGAQVRLTGTRRPVKAVTVTRRARTAAQTDEPKQARGALRRVEEGAAIWPAPYADHIIRRPDGTFTGQLNSAEGMATMLPRDTGPQGVPIRSLTLHNGYQMPVATAWRHGGVTYVIQHRDNDVSRARAEKVKERLRAFHDTLPAEAQRWQRSYAFTLDPNPMDPVFAQRFGDPDFASSASAGGGQLIIWDAGTHMHLDRGDTIFFDDLHHEVGHNVARASGAVPSFDSPSPRVAELIRSSDPRGRVREFFPLPRALTTSMYAAVKNWGTFKPPPGEKIMVPNGVTPYGRKSYGENFAEAHALYLLGVIGYGKLGNSNHSEPIYFRDLFPEWAALFDELYPDFARQQLKTIADERLPQRRPRVTRQAVRRIQASAVRGSHTPQYHQALPERS
jgi:hypothetical protein